MWIIPFVLGIPFALLFVLGDLVARPLDKHRHKNVPLWLLWSFLRFSLLCALILGLLIVLYFLKRGPKGH